GLKPSNATRNDDGIGSAQTLTQPDCELSSNTNNPSKSSASGKSIEPSCGGSKVVRSRAAIGQSPRVNAVIKLADEPSTGWRSFACQAQPADGSSTSRSRSHRRRCGSTSTGWDSRKKHCCCSARGYSPP